MCDVCGTGFMRSAARTGFLSLAVLNRIAPQPGRKCGFALSVIVQMFHYRWANWLTVFASLGTPAVAWLAFSGAVVKCRTQTKSAATFSPKTDAV